MKQSVGEKLCSSCKVVIASYHDFSKPLSYQENTDMLSKVLKNPYINILGHCDRIPGGFDLDIILPIAKQERKVIELNCNSLLYGDDAKTKLIKLAMGCKKYGVMVSIGSDAHIAYEIGGFQSIELMLQEICFPEKLIATIDEDKFVSVIERQKI